MQELSVDFDTRNAKCFAMLATVTGGKPLRIRMANTPDITGILMQSGQVLCVDRFEDKHTKLAEIDCRYDALASISAPA